MITPVSTLSDYHRDYARSVSDPEGFWAEQAETFLWRKKWDKVLEWNFTEPSVKWFIGGKLNITENCLDRHLETRGDQLALIWEPNDQNSPPYGGGVAEGWGGARHFTYRELHTEVCRVANMLKANGARKGDRICIYMPMVPELAMAVLACARIGAIHSVVFAGFSAQSLADRINDSACSMVLTADGLYRGAKQINLKEIVDEALHNYNCDSVKRVIVLRRTGQIVAMTSGRDVWWHDSLPFGEGEGGACQAELMDSEDMLFILYTSGSTGKPKGVVHTCGGYMVYAEYSFVNVFQPGKGAFWCTADIGWITGHTYIIYGPLLAGVTTMMFEGIPTWPDAGRFWQVIDKHKVEIFYTAPTAIRSLMMQGLEFVKPYKLDSLRVIGSVGEPINEEAWHWYHDNIGKGRCPIVDTWWQTETGGILISPLAGITSLIPSYATMPLPGVQPVIVDHEGREITEPNVEGNLCIRFPWPGIVTTTYGDHERCRLNYFSQFKDMYFTGDGAKRDANGNYRIIGRVDDVIKVSGHRIGTAEVENAINEHPDVVESAVVAFPHDIKGQGIYAFVITSRHDGKEIENEVREIVAEKIGPIARPDKIQVVTGLPKTRSGKIMRRILRKVAEGDTANLGDTSTLLDPAVVEEIKAGAK